VIDYEILLMLDPDLPEERQGEIVDRTRELVERGGGTWQSHDVWGRRRLAYEIRHKADGAYHLLRFAATAEALEEMSRVLKITDGVMRHIAVRQPAAPPPRPGGPVETSVERRQDSDEQPSPVA
jgi:small subunit ribosomal protein S6